MTSLRSLFNTSMRLGSYPWNKAALLFWHQFAFLIKQTAFLNGLIRIAEGRACVSLLHQAFILEK